MYDSPVHPTLIRRQWRVIESPVSQIILCGIGIPLLDRSMDSNLHPVPLRLVVSIFGGDASTWNRFTKNQRTYKGVLQTLNPKIRGSGKEEQEQLKKRKMGGRGGLRDTGVGMQRQEDAEEQGKGAEDYDGEGPEEAGRRPAPRQMIVVVMLGLHGRDAHRQWVRGHLGRVLARARSAIQVPAHSSISDVRPPLSGFSVLPDAPPVQWFFKNKNILGGGPSDFFFSYK